MKTSTKRREQTNNGKIKNSHNNIKQTKQTRFILLKNLKITPLLATHILYLTLVKVTSVIFFF